MEHPSITKVNKLGYLEEAEIAGIDYFGNTIYVGDEIVEDTNTGQIVNREQLEEYLMRNGFKFYQAE